MLLSDPWLKRIHISPLPNECSLYIMRQVDRDRVVISPLCIINYIIRSVLNHVNRVDLVKNSYIVLVPETCFRHKITSVVNFEVGTKNNIRVLEKLVSL